MIPDTGDVLARLERSGHNTGNLFIGWSLAAQIDAVFERCPTVERAQQLRSRCDFLVIAAANFVSPHFDMGRMADIVEAADLPCVVAGLGAQAPRMGEKIEAPEGTRRLLRAISERANAIGVRGAYTAEVLSDYGIRNVEITGCPSLYLAAREYRSVGEPEPSKFAVNGSTDVVPHSADPEKMASIEGDLYRQAMDFGADYVLQSERLEVEIMAGGEVETRFQALRARFPKLAHASNDRLARFIREQCKIFFEIDGWTAHMRDKAVSIGSRFHGNVAALHAGTPALFICHDARTTEMCQFAGLPHVAIGEVDDPYLPALAQRIDMAPFQRRLPDLRQAFRRFLKRNGAPSLSPAQVNANRARKDKPR